MNQNDDLIRFICSLPELKKRFGDIVPIRSAGQNSLVFLAKEGLRAWKVVYDPGQSKTSKKIS